MHAHLVCKLYFFQDLVSSWEVFTSSMLALNDSVTSVSSELLPDDGYHTLTTHELQQELTRAKHCDGITGDVRQLMTSAQVRGQEVLSRLPVSMTKERLQKELLTMRDRVEK